MTRFPVDASRDQLLERPLPHSAESERAILGAIILDNSHVNQAIELLRPEDFYIRAHQFIFRAMTGLSERGAEINPILLGEELRREGLLEQTGGLAYVSELTYGLPHFTNLSHYGKIVHDKSMLRQLVKVSNKITSEALEEEDEAGVILDHAEQMIFALADERTRQGFSHVKPIADHLLEKVQEMSGRTTVITGLATGFKEIDEMTSGLQPADLIVIAARPSMGKCLAFDSEIVLADGGVSTIEEIYQARDARLLTLIDDFKFRITSPSDFVDDGVKPVFRVTTRLGRTVETTLTHPFLTVDGWQSLGRLKVGERVALPRVIDVFGAGRMRECEVKLLAYMLGDGCLRSSSPVFTVGKPALRSDFESAVAAFGGVETRPANSKDRTFSLRIRRAAGGGRANPVTLWLKELGVYGHDSKGKFIPAQVFKLRRELVALFLNRLFATDGWATVLASGQAQLGYASASERLARQVQHLLLRFGVIAALKKRSVKYREGRKAAWQLDVTDQRSIRTFIEGIGILGKEAALLAVARALEGRRYQTNRDLIPVKAWERVSALKGEESWASLARRAGLRGHTNIHVGKRALTRGRLLALAGALKSEELERLATSEVYWDEIVSIEPAGAKQVYDLTIPDTHNFVANDMCVHNTSLCLTLAQNAAILTGAVVGIFSLEMSKESLVMRMLCSEGRVDAHRFRGGYLHREEWARLAGALGTLADTKIFIDDTPGISVLEMRAKARRLAAEQKRLDLIVVDYLQLMSGSSRRVESRQQEVSQISRELKGLAKELNVPLVALSQLSRAPETRGGDHKPILSDLRESGCLTGDSLITLADRGTRVPIRNLVGQSGFSVWALNEETLKIERAIVSRAFSTGVKPVYHLTTKLGRSIRATGNHKFRTLDGWRRLDELVLGERLALPRVVPCKSSQTMTEAELALLGHLIGDGCTLPRHVIQYTTREKDLAESVASLAVKVFGGEVSPRINQERQWYQVYLSSTRHHTHNVRSAVAEWLEGLGVWGLRSYEKFVPGKVFEQPQAAIVTFIRHLWATDGCIWADAKGKHHPGIYYASSSRRLVCDVQSLLLRVGINAKFRKVAQGDKGRDQYHAIVSGKADIEKFVSVIGAVGSYKSQALSKVKEFTVQTTANTNRDVIPSAVWRNYIVPAMIQARVTTREMIAGIGTAYRGAAIYEQNISRERASRIARVVHSEALYGLSQSDIYWDEIASIKPTVEEEVFDLTVEQHHNFIANDIFTHNSIEQDADVVAFIFREEQYNRTEENAGMAELIIAKQRNGPTGTVKLAFLKEFTRFENMWRE